MSAPTGSGSTTPKAMEIGNFRLPYRAKRIMKNKNKASRPMRSNDDIEKFFALDNLSGGLAANSGLDDGFHIGDVDAVPRDFLAVGIDDETGLAQFADYS